MAAFHQNTATPTISVHGSCTPGGKMAEASIPDQDQFICPVCLHLPNDPVTIPCGHSFCMVCINNCWDQEDPRGVYSCPQCRDTFTPRPVPCRSYFIAEMLEKLKKTELRAAPPARPKDVECDFCAGRKLRAVMSCLTCLVSFCKDHLRLHYQRHVGRKHHLVKASNQLQEKICTQHGELIEMYCRTDQRCICYLCAAQEHKGHDTVAAVEERNQKQTELKEVQRRSEQRLLQKKKLLQELQQAGNTVGVRGLSMDYSGLVMLVAEEHGVDWLLESSAQAAVEMSEKLLTELIHSIRKRRSEVAELIRAQEMAALIETEELMEKLRQEMADLNIKDSELEVLSHTRNHVHFLQRFQPLCLSSESEDLSSTAVHQCVSFGGVIKSLSKLKEELEQLCSNAFSKISEEVSAAAVQKIISVQELKTREDFLQYWCHLTLDPNTLNDKLCLSEDKREVTWRGGDELYSDHPERFYYRLQ
ncbi:hypothetical protein NFI96_013385, partial [Prochilodus magdalenae]